MCALMSVNVLWEKEVPEKYLTKIKCKKLDVFLEIFYSLLSLISINILDNIH